MYTASLVALTHQSGKTLNIGRSQGSCLMLKR
jgi:hypothetical protein